MTTIDVKSSKMDAIIGQEQTIALFSILQDYFQQGLLKEIQCPVVHPLHVWNSFLKLNR